MKTSIVSNEQHDELSGVFFKRRKITSEKVVEVKVVLCVKENLAS